MLKKTLFGTFTRGMGVKAAAAVAAAGMLVAGGTVLSAHGTPPEGYESCDQFNVGSHNGYVIKNDSAETLVLQSATRWTDDTRTIERQFTLEKCEWGDEPPAEIAPGDEIEFSLSMGVSGNRGSRDWWDRTDVMYGARSDSSRVVRFDANVGFKQEWTSGWGYWYTLIDDKSRCSGSAACSTKKSSGRLDQTVFTVRYL